MIIVDVNIERVLPKGFFHWAVINIPGNRIEDGNEVRNCKFFTFICTLKVMEYVPPFHFKLNEDGSLVKDPQESASPMLVLVFKQVTPWKLEQEVNHSGCVQEGRIWSEETHAGCDPEIVERMFDYRELAEKYNLEVVAGNFFQVFKPDKKVLCFIFCGRCPGVGSGPKR